MSWTAYTVAKPDDLEKHVAEIDPPGESFPEREDQVAAAKKAVLALVKSGAVGDGEAFQVTLSGHANTDHKPAQGWANDVVTVSVAQTNAAAVQAFEQQQRNLQ